MNRKLKALFLGLLISFLAYSIVACNLLGGGGKLTGSTGEGVPYGLKVNPGQVSGEGALYGIFPSAPK